MSKSTVIYQLICHLLRLTTCLSLSFSADYPSLSPNTTLNLTSATQGLSAAPTAQTWHISNLSALNPPPGFGINLVFNSAQVLSPIGVYNVALETLYRLAQHPWSSKISQSVVFSLPAYREQVLFEPSAQRRLAGELPTGYAVLALYAGVCAMTPPTRNLFYDLKVLINHEGTPVGQCTIHSASPSAKAAESSNTTSMLEQASSFNISAFTADTGRMADPEDPRFSLSWTFTGARLNSRDVFLAAMDGIAAAARFSPAKRCAQLSAATPRAGSGVVVNMSSMKHPQRVRFTYHYASRALLLISRVMQAENRFGVMGFYMEYEGYKFGEGFVKQRPEGGGGGVAVE